MRDRIRELMAGLWGVPLELIPPDATTETLEGWESLRHLELMLELELTFGVRIAVDEVAELRSIDAIEDALGAHGVV